MVFLQAARNSAVHALGDEIRQISDRASPVVTRIMFDAPHPDDIESGKCDGTGLITQDFLAQHTPLDEADYHCCGAKPFISSILKMLHELGVDRSRCHSEFFGPKQKLATA